MFDKSILQYGSLAGWPYTIAHTLREKGIASSNVIFYDRDESGFKRNLKYDSTVCDLGDTKLEKIAKACSFVNELSRECGLVHYHGATVFPPEYHFIYEGRVLRKANVPMLISFGGGDARPLGIANRLNKYFYRDNDFFHELRINLRYFSWSRNIKYCATDPEMKEYALPHFDRVFTFRQPIDLARIPEPTATRSEKPVVLHIPTEPEVKGTAYIVKAVDRLRQKKLDFDFVMKTGLSQSQVYDEISKCDIYVDELRCGSHGVTAVESMAAGKPTITYIRDDLLDKFPAELPLVNANPDTIERVLEKLLVDTDLRRDIGRNSRAYVEKYHCASVVADELIEIYQGILRD
ncbi:glycosyltransferase family 4 protein [Motiliproteus sediminis]|uniref:glycosyltransferase family 4 protein n=1 Tax=Motiliproteus sediminis TaxID=1468178 RepID=UPI001AEF96E6|nr:glycosyltransferase family 4 protein [Motiliproteus sediminis]